MPKKRKREIPGTVQGLIGMDISTFLCPFWFIPSLRSDTLILIFVIVTTISIILTLVGSFTGTKKFFITTTVIYIAQTITTFVILIPENQGFNSTARAETSGLSDIVPIMMFILGIFHCIRFSLLLSESSRTYFLSNPDKQ